MESLSDTVWDVVLSGTGLPQSLLALALSRSGKKILHIDKNDYYGGSEAALSLQEVESWAGRVEKLGEGSWWLYDTEGSKDAGGEEDFKAVKASLKRIPGGREDVFADKSIDLRSSRSLMKFLKLAADPEAHTSILEEWGSRPFPDILGSHLNIPSRLQAPLLALTSSQNIPARTLTSYALPSIHRHLTSIGLFGPGFGAVIPKWGGLAEIAQVACRAQAVGGGVYILKKGFETNEDPAKQAFGRDGTRCDNETGLSTVRLEGEDIKTRWIVGSAWDLPSRAHVQELTSQVSPNYVARSITIVNGSLSQLFPSPVESAPPTAGAVVVYPTDTLELESEDQKPNTLKTEVPPIYLIVHSSDTGECPVGQCVIYAYAFHPKYYDAHSLLQIAVEKLLSSVSEDPSTEILWHLHYDQQYVPPGTAYDYEANIRSDQMTNSNVLQLPDLEPSLVLEDGVLKHVKAAYERIAGEGTAFMLFEDREGAAEEDHDGAERE
ncbi:hypothetical protein P7C71_g1955, partial [Lecanoromycetidae sp. Uapishka_2]